MKVVIDAAGRRVEVDASADEHRGGLPKLLERALTLWAATEPKRPPAGFVQLGGQVKAS